MSKSIQIEGKALSSLKPVSLEAHAKSSWRRMENFQFAAKEILCSTSMLEISNAALALPIAFASRDGEYVPAFVLGLEMGKNLLVSAEGKWLGSYIPLSFRCYPFVLAKDPEGTSLLCIDEEAATVDDGSSGSEAFFNEDGSVGPLIGQILDLLSQDSQSKAQTAPMCQLLDKRGLIVPWDLKVEHDGGVLQIDGLSKVDESKLGDLSGEELVELRDAGCLQLIFCHLLSLQNINLLVHLFRGESDSTDYSKSAGFNLNQDEGSLSFDNF